MMRYFKVNVSYMYGKLGADDESDPFSAMPYYSVFATKMRKSQNRGTHSGFCKFPVSLASGWIAVHAFLRWVSVFVFENICLKLTSS